jgi:hypothetical protein
LLLCTFLRLHLCDFFELGQEVYLPTLTFLNRLNS